MTDANGGGADDPSALRRCVRELAALSALSAVWSGSDPRQIAAYLLPQSPDRLMPADGSAVNQFRHIFNHYFNERLAILPSRHYFSDFERPYAFVDVTFPQDVPE